MNYNKSFKELFEDKLLRDYPEKIIKGMNEQTVVLQQIKTFCELNSLDYRQELKNLGFQQYRKGTILENEIPDLLEDIFPDKTIEKLGSIRECHSQLDTRINKFHKERKMSKKEYLKSIGFNVRRL
ncbi:hypothetical protein GCM10022378_01270 [Salinicoccus jeotgali]|uniref:Transposase n=1 Tax=Salinicoccus jeotgali TaxID=381634 RepID=A0ABP7E4P7_9STAP